MNKKKTVSLLVSRDDKQIPVSKLDYLITKFAEAYLDMEIEGVDKDSDEKNCDKNNNR